MTTNTIVRISFTVTMLAIANLLQAAPIHDAAGDGDLEKVTKLLQKTPSALNAKDNHGMTPLHLAAREGRKDVVELLLSKGADVNAKYETSGGTPLHVAALNGRAEVVSMLLARGAEVNAKNKDGMTPLSGALAESHEDVAKLLREKGAVEPEAQKPRVEVA